MVRIENRKGGGAKLVSCDVDMRIRHDIDLVTFNPSRKCLSQPARIRVAVSSNGSNGAADWAGFSPLLPMGSAIGTSCSNAVTTPGNGLSVFRYAHPPVPAAEAWNAGRR